MSMSADRWEFQLVAIDRCQGLLQAGYNVVLVAPTGAGKTRMGCRIVGNRRTLWVVPQIELAEQAERQLRELYGPESVGIVRGSEWALDKRIRVGTVQTLLRRGDVGADLLVLDEAHHYCAEDWNRITELCKAPRLGLTAFPQRFDGKPLRGLFDQMVVAAKNSDLIAAGVLVPVTVWRPALDLGNDLAMDPREAWEKLSGGQQGFAYFVNVDRATEFAGHMQDARCVSYRSAKVARRRIMYDFEVGLIPVISNVKTMAEGIDVPQASVAMLARKFEFLGNFVQVVGRIMRAADGKGGAVLLDLVGASIHHGHPNADWDYEAAFDREEPEPGGKKGPVQPGPDEPTPRDIEQRILGVPLLCDGNPRKRIVPEKRPEERRQAEYLSRQFRKRGKRSADALKQMYRRMGRASGGTETTVESPTTTEALADHDASAQNDGALT